MATIELRLPRRQKRFKEEQVYEAFAKAMGAIPSTTARGKPVDVRAIVQQAANSLSPMVGRPPDDVIQALADQGMDYQGLLGPGDPLHPWFGYGRDPRTWDYTTGRNVSSMPRSDRLPFATLKVLNESYDVAGICQRHIISDLLSMDLQFMAADGVKDDVSEDIEQAKQFWRKPDGKRRFRHWLAMWFGDVLKYDAGTLHVRRSNDGKLLAPWSPKVLQDPSTKYGLAVITGPSIAPMVDFFGDIPWGKAPAAVQFIQGTAWDWLFPDEIIYEPFTPSTEGPYGMPPVETVILNANLDVRFQWHFLNYFTDGNIPEGFLTAPPDLSSPTQVAEWQEYWDAVMLGDQDKLRQLRFVPFDTKYIPTKDTAFDEKFPEYLMRRTVAAHQLTPADLGFTETVNKSSGETQTDIQFRISTEPRTGYIEDILNEITQDELHLRVKVQFDTGREKEDRLQEAQAWDLWIKNGAASADEPRETVLGLEVNAKERVPRFVMARTGLVPLRNLLEIAGATDPATDAPEVGSVVDISVPGYQLPVSVPPAPGSTPPGLPPATAPPQAGPAPLPGVPAAEQKPAAPVVAPMAKAETAGITAATGIAGVDLVEDEDDEDEDEELDEEAMLKALEDWRTNSKRRLRRGQKPRPFVGIPLGIALPIWEELSKASNWQEVDEVFSKAAKSNPKALGPLAP